jgi:hypothetical protein
MSAGNIDTFVNVLQSAGVAVASLTGLGWWLSGKFVALEQRLTEKIDRIHDETTDKIHGLEVRLASHGMRRRGPWNVDDLPFAKD